MDLGTIITLGALGVMATTSIIQTLHARKTAGGGTPAPVVPVPPGAGTFLPHILSILQQLQASGQPIDPKHPLLGIAASLLQAELASVVQGK